MYGLCLKKHLSGLSKEPVIEVMQELYYFI